MDFVSLLVEDTSFDGKNTFMTTYSFTYSNPISIIFDIYFICILSDVSTILCYITNNLLYLVNAINDCLLFFQRCFLK